MRAAVTILLALSLGGCASYFKRKACEETNWFQHGENVAMQGMNLENDPFLNQCRKVEADIDEAGLDRGFKKGRANYCEPDTAYMTGKNGDPFAAHMCDVPKLALLKKRHEEGVRAYCQPSNGEPTGASGKEYQKVCPRELEAAFLKEYKKGRKKYLVAEVTVRQSRVDEIEREIRSLESQHRAKTLELASLNSGGTRIVRERVNTLGGRRVREEVNVGNANTPELQAARDEVKREIDRIEWDIRRRRQDQSKVREEIRKLQAELLTL